MTWCRESRHVRGYGAAWTRIRAAVLKRDCHICQCPECLGGALRVRPAGQVDHIVPKAQGGTDDPDNLRAVNAECHQRITQQQQGKAPRPGKGCDASGMPTSPNHPWNKT